MGIMQQIRDRLAPQPTIDLNRQAEARKISQEIRNQLHTSALCSDYENVFSQVRPLIDEMLTVTPYGVGRNGAAKSLRETPALELLLTDPNSQMSGLEFLDTAFATWLTENQLFIRVHHKGKRIQGYTLLGASSYNKDIYGNESWQITKTDGTTETIYKEEVATLRYSRSPRTLEGVSPASAVRVYAQIDDLLAQFEKAYLENGAIPASITIIRASSQAKYNEKRAELERGLKGASNKNKTLYIWRQFNNDDGSEKDQVEVKTIQGNNNTLAIEQIVAVVNDRLNKAYGVSNFIMGDDSSAKYDNAELSDYQFTRRRVLPALRKFWSQFQHELDRITGGLGYAIDFKLDMPELTDRKKTIAEIANINVTNLTALIKAGATPDEACKALDLDAKSWKEAAVGIYNRTLADRELLTLASTQSAPLAETAESGQDEAIPATDLTQTRDLCQGHAHHHTADYYQPFSDDEKVEKEIFERLIALARAIFEENPNIDLDGISDEIFRLLEDEANAGGEQALKAIQALTDDPEIEKALAEIIKNGVQISDDLGRRLHERVNQLVIGYDQHTREIMRAVLESGEALTAEQIRERLEGLLPNGKAATIARNEVVYAMKSGRLELDQGIADKYGLEIQLEWATSPEAGEVCPLCEAMEGKITTLGQAFKPQAVAVPKEDGTIDFQTWEPSIWNDEGRIPNAHTNCKCYFQEHLIRKA